MATYNEISGAEPSTVTFKLATVSQDWNSTVRHQEIVTIGGTESTLAQAAVLNITPGSTAWALAVREVAPTTLVAVSSLSGAVNMRSSAANALVTVYQSTAADLNVTVAGYVAPSTTVAVSTGSVRVIQSTAGDLNVTVAGYSTTANVSSVSGRVSVAPSDTNWASSAGFHFNSSGELQTVAAVTTSTTVNVSSVTGRVSVAPSDTNWASSAGFHFDSSGALQTVASFTGSTTVNVSTGAITVYGNTSSNSSAYLSVRLTNGTAFLDATEDYAVGDTISTVSLAVLGPTMLMRTGAPAPASTDTWKQVYGSTYGVLYTALATSSGVSAMDSTQTALRVNVVAGSAAGDTTVSVSTGSVRVVQSTAADLNVTVAGYSTTVNVSSLGGAVIVRSSAADMLVTASTGSVRVHQSTAADLNVTVAGYSTIVSVSTGSVRVHQSTAADLNVTVAGYSTTVNVSSLAGAVTARVNTSSGGAVEGSTTVPSASALGLHVRHVLPTMASAVSTVTSTASTAFYTVISSVAGITQKVFAYSITSTAAAPIVVEFLQSTVTVVWGLDLGSGSSGVTGANLAVQPPGALFQSSVAGNISLRLGTSGVQVRYSVAYFST